MNSLPISPLEKLAAALVEGARMELYLTPKPGLVDRADSGSHPDLSIRIMESSIAQVAGYLEATVASLTLGEPFVCQRKIGIAAERRLFDTLGTNTHKGFIFLSGMLLIACWHAGSMEEKALRATLSSLAGDFFASGEEEASNGRRARKRYHAGGIVSESIDGFPSLFEHALPAYRTAMHRNCSFSMASFAMLAQLMQRVDDTTTLHRGGQLGLARVRRDGRQLARIVACGEDPAAYLREVNRSYIRMNITMGGIADMLGLSYGYLIASGEIVLAAQESETRFEAASPAC